MGNAIQDTVEQLATRTTALVDVLNIENRTTRVAAELESRGYGPSGHFKHAPSYVLAEQRKEIHAALDAEAAERLRDIEDAVRESLEDLPAIEAHARVAPTALQVFQALHKAYSAGDLLQVQILEELRIARFQKEVGTMGPAAVLDLYAGAVAVGGEDADAIIRFVEERLPRNWAGTATSPEDAIAVQHLARAIRATQEARIPQDVKDWRAAVTAARKAVTLARDAHRVVPATRTGVPSEKTKTAVNGARRAMRQPAGAV